MQSIAIIFPPNAKTRDDVITAFHLHAKAVEFIDLTAVAQPDPVSDAEPSPLWRGFVPDKGSNVTLNFN